MPKEKLTLYLEPEHIEWLESQTDEEKKYLLGCQKLN